MASEPEKWRKCKHNIPSLAKKNSVYCQKEEGYVSPKWCELCPKFEEETPEEKEEKP
jgi:hypothetical protein